MKKTKIVCTLGPACSRLEVLVRMLHAGMNVARINMSHGDHAMHRRLIDTARRAAHEIGVPLAIMCDTKGPGIRTGELAEDKVFLQAGQTLILSETPLAGTRERIAIDYPGLHRYLKPGDAIWLNDGEIELHVVEPRAGEIVCRVHNDGVLGPHKGVNLPGVDLPAFEPSDDPDVRFAVEAGADYVSASFVRTPADLEGVRRLVADSAVQVIAKIETRQAVEHIDAILPLADALMVARGDLGVELPLEQVPLIQKMLVNKCKALGKPVIVATQMLKSMVKARRPTRAEVTDVANAILDGADAIMLSEETAVGDHPVHVVDTMRRIALEAESQEAVYRTPPVGARKAEAIAEAACRIAAAVGAQAILPTTSSGSTARAVAKFRPPLPIVAVTYSPIVRHQLALVWGVEALLTELQAEQDTERMLQQAVQVAREAGKITPGRPVVVTAGTPFGVSGTTNLIKVIEV